MANSAITHDTALYLYCHVVYPINVCLPNGSSLQHTDIHVVSMTCHVQQKASGKFAMCVKCSYSPKLRNW